MKKSEKALIESYRRLPREQQQALVDYVEWLTTRYATVSEEPATTPDKPLDIPRPEEESVVKAIRRLSNTYPMLDTSEMLTKTSSFMTRHVMEGQDGGAIIDEMEDYFRECYEKQAGDADGA